MSIALSELYLSTKTQYQLNLIAGEKGLFSPINWVQFNEDINTINFLKGGELIITTGMSKNSDQWLSDFVKKLITQKTSGLIIGLSVKRASFTQPDSKHFHTGDVLGKNIAPPD